MTTGAITFADALPATAELVIIGGGVIGAATADAARRAGLQPLVLEARPMLASATTSVATGAYRLQQDDPRSLPSQLEFAYRASDEPQACGVAFLAHIQQHLHAHAHAKQRLGGCCF